ncbi:MAG TPA: hypothetical protein P5526_03355 [Anaerolineae bacterium]|nr:hypothetical protein [Anaerolineae bacterium]
MTITFITGPAGVGKTGRAVETLRGWLTNNIPANNILVLVPQLTLAQPYRDLLRDSQLAGAGTVDVLTMNGLALKTIDLFWPLIAAPAGSGRPTAPPIFLTIETAQYYLQQAITPLLRQGYFDPNVVPLTISLPRLMSQILDNLNKAALMGLPHTQVGQRLAASVALEPSSRVALEHTQACVNRFREFCLARNLLDFSLRIETFDRHLWPVAGVKQFILNRYRYLIVDNIEEDNPFAHRILRDWLPKTAESLVIYDEDAGYRIFLGANWRTAHKLSDLADDTIRLTGSHVAPPLMLELGRRAARILGVDVAVQTENLDLEAKAKAEAKQDQDISKSSAIPNNQLPITNHQLPISNFQSPLDPRLVMTFEQQRFYPQMIDWVVARIAALIKEDGVSPNEIVVLAPFVSDALRFSFTNKMAQLGLPARSHRPSRPLSEEPAAKTLLTLARLAYPHWQLLPEPFDVTQAMAQSIAGLDLIRANLLTQVVYRPHQKPLDALANIDILYPFEQIEGNIRDRISYDVGVKFDRLRTWLLDLQNQADPPVLDHFFNRLFELLSQPGFGFYGEQEAGEVIANLIDSARQFRQVAEQVPLAAGSNGQDDVRLPTIDELNRAYLATIEEGIAAAQYIRSWDAAPDEAVLITPATTFLMSNRPVDYQFWLDAGSSGWWERIAQPLTHPYILTEDYPAGRPWTDADEVAAQQDRLYRLVVGLTRRCRQHVFITNAEVGEQGYEQRGQLLIVLQQMLRQLQREDAANT